MITSRHKTTIDLPLPAPGCPVDADTDHIKVDVEYRYIPSENGPILDVIKSGIVGSRELDETVLTLNERVQDYFDRDGYAMACDQAETERTDWE